jgi:hypothetical protein
MDNISTKAEAEGDGETETLTRARAKRKVTNSLVTNTFKLASDEDLKIIKRLFVRTGKSSRSSHSKNAKFTRNFN